MKVGVLITARMKSERLKFKALKKLNGYSIIERIIQRAKEIAIHDGVVLCTSTNHQDLPLVEIAQKQNINYFNGHPDDVLQRLLDASLFYNYDYIVCLTGDNPLFSIHYANVIIDHVIKNNTTEFIYSSGNPLGVSINAISVKTLSFICSIKNHVDTEIWGNFVNHPELFNVVEIVVNSDNYIDIDRLTVDEHDDYLQMKKIFDSFDKNAIIEESDIISFFKDNLDVKKINLKVVQKDLDDSIKKDLNKFYSDNLKELIVQKAKYYENY